MFSGNIFPQHNTSHSLQSSKAVSLKSPVSTSKTVSASGMTGFFNGDRYTIPILLGSKPFFNIDGRAYKKDKK